MDEEQIRQRRRRSRARSRRRRQEEKRRRVLLLVLAVLAAILLAAAGAVAGGRKPDQYARSCFRETTLASVWEESRRKPKLQRTAGKMGSLTRKAARRKRRKKL